MKVASVLRSPKRSWEKDNTLAEANHPFEQWVEFLLRVFNLCTTVEELGKIPVPPVPHLISREVRHQLRRGYVIMPQGIDLKDIWTAVARLGGLTKKIDLEFLSLVNHGDRRKEESHIVRFSTKGNPLDKGLDRLHLSLDEVRKKEVPTMRVSELLMFFLFHLYMAESFPPTMTLGTVFPESVVNGKLVYLSFEQGYYVSKGKMRPYRSVKRPLSVATRTRLPIMMDPSLTIGLSAESSVPHSIYLPRQVII